MAGGGLGGRWRGEGRASRRRRGTELGPCCGRSSVLGRPAVPCGRKEAQLPLIMFLLLPPARMRGDCRFCRLQVTAGDLVVLPRGDPRPEQPQLSLGAQSWGAGEPPAWSPSASLGCLLTEPFLASFFATVPREERVTLFFFSFYEESANVAVGCFRKHPSGTLP